MNKIPVNIISGFLGAGKTTAIIKILKMVPDNEKWAVIINEFGKISVDGQVIAGSGASAGDIYNIAGGCICCTAGHYFRENLEKIVDSGQFSRILIEPSGLGGLDMVSEALKENKSLVMNPTICMVDILGIENPRLQMNMIYRDQISKAAAIVFTKHDLVRDPQERKRLEQVFFEKHSSTTALTGVTTEVFDFITSNAEDQQYKDKHYWQIAGNRNNDLTDKDYKQDSFSFEDNLHFDVDALGRFLTDERSVVRAKGYIKSFDKWYLFNYTISGFHLHTSEPRKSGLIVIISSKTDARDDLEESLRKLASLPSDNSTHTIKGKLCR